MDFSPIIHIARCVSDLAEIAFPYLIAPAIGLLLVMLIISVSAPKLD